MSMSSGMNCKVTNSPYLWEMRNCPCAHTKVLNTQQSVSLQTKRPTLNTWGKKSTRYICRCPVIWTCDVTNFHNLYEMLNFQCAHTSLSWHRLQCIVMCTYQTQDYLCPAHAGHCLKVLQSHCTLDQQSTSILQDMFMAWNHHEYLRNPYDVFIR